MQTSVIISGQNLRFLATVLLCNNSMDKMFVQQVNRVHTRHVATLFIYIINKWNQKFFNGDFTGQSRNIEEFTFGFEITEIDTRTELSLN